MNILSIILAASLFIPQGSVNQSRQNPLSIGEAAFYDNGNGEANLVVGNGTTLPNRIVDLSALRGYRLSNLSRNLFAVIGDATLTRDATTDSWEGTMLASETHTVTFFIPDKIEFYDVKITAKTKVTGGMMFNDADVTYIREGNKVTCSIKPKSATEEPTDVYTVIVNSPIVEVLDFGDPDMVTDLRTTKFKVIDDIGKTDLCNFRKWAYNCRNGNLGEDWYKYSSSGDTHIIPYHDERSTTLLPRYSPLNNGLSFDADPDMSSYYKIYYDVNSTNLCFKGGGMTPIEIEARGTDTNSLHFTKITYERASDGVSYVYMDFACAIQDFDASFLDLYYSPQVTTNSTGNIPWVAVPAAKVTIDKQKVRVDVRGLAATSGEVGFFKMVYRDTVVATAKVYLRGNIIVEGDITVYGPSNLRENVSVANTANLTVSKMAGLRLYGDDGKLYEIHVNAGVITATEVVTP